MARILDADTVLAVWWRRLQRQGDAAVARAVPSHTTLLRGASASAKLQLLARTQSGQAVLQRHLRALTAQAGAYRVRDSNDGGAAAGDGVRGCSVGAGADSDDAEELAAVWFAAATVHRALGDSDGALAAAKRAVALDSSATGAATLLEVLRREAAVVRVPAAWSMVSRR